jgi:hypothetical protein
MQRLTIALATSFCLAAAFATQAAHAAWNQPVGGPSPINHAKDESNQNAFVPSLTAIGGTPYVAWTEFDGNQNSQARVSRLNAAGTAWEEVVGGASPINHLSSGDATGASLAAIGNVPYIAWEESSGSTWQVWVSRLNAAGTAWEQVGGPSPVGTAPTGTAASLTSIGGVPYVAWTGGSGVRVSRLNATGTAWEQVGGLAGPGALSFDATLTSIGGVPYVAWIESDADGYEVRVSRLNAAGTAWEEVAPGASPINHAPGDDSFEPSITAIGGVPYVTWAEHDGTNFEIRVSRLNVAHDPTWDEVGGGASPINYADDQHARTPSLTDIGGVPYVAWAETEADDDNTELRVSRLSGDGQTWEEVVGGASPINVASNRAARDPSLTAIGGVPYVAWAEQDATDIEIRVSRLEPEFLTQSVLTNDGEALLLSRVRTYGVAYPIAVQYGPGAQLDRQTATTPTAYDVHEDTWFQQIPGLAPGAGHSWRPIGFDGARVTGLGPTQAFTTRPAPSPPEPGGAPPEPTSPAPASRLLVAVLQPRLKALAGRRVTVDYIATLDAAVTLEVRRCGGKVVARLRAATAARAGRNKITWNGRIGRARARPGCYILAVKASSSDGQTASDRAKLRLTRRAVRPN